MMLWIFISHFSILREDLSDSVIKVTDIQNPYIVGYVPKV